MKDKLTKQRLSELLGISRPTLDKYLKEGFPIKYTNTFSVDSGYRKILLENEIRLCEYKLTKLKEELNNLERL